MHPRQQPSPPPSTMGSQCSKPAEQPLGSSSWPPTCWSHSQINQRLGYGLPPPKRSSTQHRPLQPCQRPSSITVATRQQCCSLTPPRTLQRRRGGRGGKVPTQGKVRKWRSAPPTKASTPLTCGLSITGTLAQASRPSGTNSDDAKAATW